MEAALVSDTTHIIPDISEPLYYSAVDQVQTDISSLKQFSDYNWMNSKSQLDRTSTISAWD